MKSIITTFVRRNTTNYTGNISSCTVRNIVAPVLSTNNCILNGGDTTTISPLLPLNLRRCYMTIKTPTRKGIYTCYGSKSLSLILPNFIQQPTLSSFLLSNHQQIRTMGSKKNKESKNQKNKAKQKSMVKKQLLQKEQQKKMHQQQLSGEKAVGDEHSLTATTTKVGGPAEQHKEWVEFQKSIVVDGFETGQMLNAIDANKKGRSGGKVEAKKRVTKREEMSEKIKERQRLAGGGGGEFPPMRYSDEETERLLKQAYASIPKRTGKRGTLNLKRQKRRWHLVKEIHRKYKGHIMKFHFRRMERRSTKMKQIMDLIANGAPTAIQQDMNYQTKVRERYMQMIESAAARAVVTTSTATTQIESHTV